GLLARSRDRDVPLSILWASMGAIYQRFGYGLATTHVTYDVPVRYVAFQFGDQPAGEVHLLDTTTARSYLESLYQQYAEPGNGLLHRGGFWDIFLQRVNGQPTHAAVYFNADDEPRGYCLYRTHWRDIGGPGPNHLIDVFDFVWLDMDAYRSLWLYLARHDLADRIRMTFVAEDDPAPNVILEPRMLGRRTWDGVWLRVVDAGSAFDARGYDVSGEAVIEVTGDELCPWNNDRYRIVTDAGETRVERGARVEPDLVTGPTGLASLVTGHTRASDLHRMGRAAMRDPKRGAALDGLFATRRRPHCPNMF
ncbi:MAG: sterol carrier protein domain-containing protein, partial [Pseudomonadales bacterium]